MNKYLKYTSLILASFVLVTPMAYAEVVPSRQLQETRKLIQSENREEIDALKKELENKREEMKTTMEAKREEFKNQIELKREEAKVKIETAKEKLKTDLLKIKDEKKKETVTKITDKIVELNKKATDNLNANLNKIDEVLTKIKAKIAEEGAKGTDIKASEDSILLADKAIGDAKTAIINQAAKSYTTTITTETELRATMSKVKELFNTDIKAVREKVKAAHVAVKNLALTLPKVEEEETNQ